VTNLCKNICILIVKFLLWQKFQAGILALPTILNSSKMQLKSRNPTPCMFRPSTGTSSHFLESLSSHERDAATFPVKNKYALVLPRIQAQSRRNPLTQRVVPVSLFEMLATFRLETYTVLDAVLLKIRVRSGIDCFELIFFGCYSLILQTEGPYLCTIVVVTTRKLFAARTTSAESSASVVRNRHTAQLGRVYGPPSCNSNTYQCFSAILIVRFM